jgi:hypothetical protein
MSEEGFGLVGRSADVPPRDSISQAQYSPAARSVSGQRPPGCSSRPALWNRGQLVLETTRLKPLVGELTPEFKKERGDSGLNVRQTGRLHLVLGYCSPKPLVN